MDRRRLLGSGCVIVWTAAALAGALVPSAVPLVGIAVAAVSIGRADRVGVAGFIVGLAAVAASLPAAVTTREQVAFCLLIGWSFTLSWAWRASSRRRRVAETAVDTVVIAASARQSGHADRNDELTRMLADILGGVRGTIVRRGEPTAVNGAGGGTVRWSRRRPEVSFPLGTRPTGSSLVIAGITRRPAAWRIDLAQRVAAGWAEAAQDWARDAPLMGSGSIDPITGLGDEQAVIAAAAALADGDAVFVVSLEDFAVLRAEFGADRAHLVLCQLGLHLRNRLRSSDLVARHGDHHFVVICRNPASSADGILNSLLATWPASETGYRLMATSSVHRRGRAPIDTLDEALRPLAHPGGDARGRISPEDSRAGRP